jgi:hypothetical protein
MVPLEARLKEKLPSVTLFEIPLETEESAMLMAPPAINMTTEKASNAFRCMGG